MTAMPTLLKALRGISLLSLLAKGASPLRTTPTLKPCVTRTGFRHLRARHRLTIPLRTVKSLPRFPAATGTPEARYCAQGFNVGPPFVGHEPTTRSTEELLVDDRNRTSDTRLYQLSYTNKGFDCCGNRHRNIPSADCEFDAIKPLVDDGFPISIRSAHCPTDRAYLNADRGSGLQSRRRSYRGTPAACAIQVTQPNTQRRAGLDSG